MYLGVDYYPEHWDINMMDSDMKRIKAMGSNIIRVGEFAWHLIERQEGRYDFSFFDMVIDKAKENGLKVIFGTPTATFPAWLAKKHPSILSEDEFGNKRVFGGRRQYCYNSKIYIKYTEELVKRLISHYKDEKNIIVWQIDNEFGHEGSDLCYCDECHKEFQIYLKNKYHSIDKLNEIYGTIFWGQTYNDFDEIPMPKPTITTHNPSLRLDWARFRSGSIYQFSKNQIDLARSFKGEHQKITHNFPGVFFDKAYDFNDIAKLLDFVSYDNYPVWGGLVEPISPAHIAMNLDYMRGLKRKNFWIVEELMGAQGHDIIGYLPRPNQAKLWAYQAMAHGCENLLFFRYRGMTKGAEQFCLGIIDQDNKEGRKYHEVRSFMGDISNYEKAVNSEIKADIAILYDFDNIWSWRCQKQSGAFNFTKELLRLYEPFYRLNMNIDVINIDKDFSNYKVILVPVMQIIDESLGERLQDFAMKGGDIIFSFRAGIKDRDNNIIFGAEYPGYIKEVAGIKIEESESLDIGQKIEIEGTGKYVGKKGSCEVWRDMVVPEAAEVLYYYNDKFYKDKACITVNNYEGGKVYYIGGGVNDDILIEIAEEIAEGKALDYIKTPLDLEAYTRRYNEEEWLFINNHNEEEVNFKGNTIKPYESRIISINGR